MMKFAFAGAIFLACVSAAAAQTVQSEQAFDPRALKQTVAGPPTSVMVLGSVHLKNLDTFEPAWLVPLVDRLVAYKPEVVTIEALSGQQCDILRRYPAVYSGVAASYCPSIELAAKATGMDVPQATAAVTAMLDTWPDQPRPAARRRLASLFLAGGEPASALVQWLRLEPAERHEGNGLDEGLVKELDRLKGNANENFQVGAVVAARAGLERVYAIDDHTADGSVSEDPGLSATLQRLWAYEGSTQKQIKAQDFDGPELMLENFRMMNRPDVQRGSIADDFGRALKDDTPEYWGRQYVAWWELRNLRMVANIRATFAQKPGARVLVIVGSTHKPYFDAYLDQMHEVKIIDTASVL